MRLTPEQVAEEKKYLSEFKEMLWFGEHVLTSVEQDLFDTIEALQQENEQLQAQAARVREVLRKAREALEQTKGFIKGIGCYCNYEGEYASQCQPCFIVEQIDKALTAVDKAIGGRQHLRI